MISTIMTVLITRVEATFNPNLNTVANSNTVENLKNQEVNVCNATINTRREIKD